MNVHHFLDIKQVLMVFTIEFRAFPSSTSSLDLEGGAG